MSRQRTLAAGPRNRRELIEVIQVNLCTLNNAIFGYARLSSRLKAKLIAAMPELEYSLNKAEKDAAASERDAEPKPAPAELAPKPPKIPKRLRIRQEAQAIIDESNRLRREREAERDPGL